MAVSVGARVAVVGGHGKTGRAVAAALRARGGEPVPLGRADWPDLAGALAGCDAAYVIAPNMHADEPAYVRDVLTAARAAGVARLVLHSVADPEAPDLPHHAGKARAERLVRDSEVAWTILRPGVYLANIDLAPDDLAPDDVPGRRLRLPYRADAPFGFVHLPDLGEAAARVLLEEGHDAATYQLASFAGSVGEVAALAGVTVEQISPEEWASHEGTGLEDRVRSWLMAMFASYQRGGLPVPTSDMSRLLGRPPTTMRQAVAAARAPMGED